MLRILVVEDTGSTQWTHLWVLALNWKSCQDLMEREDNLVTRLSPRQCKGGKSLGTRLGRWGVCVCV